FAPFAVPTGTHPDLGREPSIETPRRGYAVAMQTFLPYEDFAATAQVLDQRRLGKQRVEALQVLRGLTRPGYGWRHRPAVSMWAATKRPWSGTAWRSAESGVPVATPTPVRSRSPRNCAPP